MKKAFMDYIVDLSLPWLVSVMLLFSFLRMRISKLIWLSETPERQGAHSKARYTGVMDCIRKVYHTEGVSGFYRGCATNLLRTTPAVVITFTSFEMIHRFLLDVFPPLPEQQPQPLKH